jgi:hypothetical protein
MFSKLHDRLGTAGLAVAIVALIVALTGTALAAGGLTGQQENQVKKIAKKFAGKRGPAGAAGPAGSTGPTGPSGPAGAKGDTGAQGGVGVAGPIGPAGQAGPAGPAGPACPEGNCYLPSKATETGTWATAFETEGLTSISFALPLKAAVEASHVKRVAEGATAPAECDNGSGEAPSAGNPEADPGYLCVFTALFESAGELQLVANPATFLEGAAKTGAILVVGSAAADKGIGTFAVTAP